MYSSQHEQLLVLQLVLKHKVWNVYTKKKIKKNQLLVLKHKVWYVYTIYVHVYTIYVQVYTSYVYMLVFKNKVWCVYAVYICMYKYYTYTCTCAHIRIAYTRRIEYIRHVVEISRILVPYVYMYTQHTPYVYIYMCHTFTCIYATRIRVCVCVCVCVCAGDAKRHAHPADDRK